MLFCILHKYYLEERHTFSQGLLSRTIQNVQLSGVNIAPAYSCVRHVVITDSRKWEIIEFYSPLMLQYARTHADTQRMETSKTYFFQF